ncbi:MAG: hypothetical protein LC808_25075 [Actinobacteria bacterium]|nr:hypothetical protein [Actinomycetota bacterium]
MPRYESLISGMSRSILRSGILDAIERSRLSLPDFYQVRALQTGAELARVISGSSYLSAFASLAEANERISRLVQTPQWIRFFAQQEAVLGSLHRQMLDVSLVTKGLDRYLRGVSAARPVLEIERPIAVSTRAWDDIVRRAPLDPSQDEALRLFTSGRGTLGTVAAGFALLDEEIDDYDDGDTRTLLSREGLAEELRNRLGSLHPDLPSRLDGAWDRIAAAGPAAASQAAHSLIELVNWSLRIAAPDEDVISWHALRRRPMNELHEGRPTRSLRAKFILRDRPDDQTAARLYLRALNDLVDTIQSLKHDLEANDVVAVARLIPTVEGLLIFLFV